MSTILKGKNPRKPHTVRYWEGGRQREKSFTTLAEARSFKTDVDHAARYCVKPVDVSGGRANFGELCEAFIARMAVSDCSRTAYASVYRSSVAPLLGDLTLAEAAVSRDAVADIIQVRMRGLSVGRRRKARQVIAGTLDEAVAAGKITEHRCGNIAIRDDGPAADRKDFVFPAHEQVQQVAERVGIAVWLMRGCGLRISEALGTEKSDFMFGGKVLRVSRQAAPDGSGGVPLKKRRRGEYRDVPVPTFLRDMVRGLPDGPLCPGRSTRYRPYHTTWGLFARAAKDAGAGEGFTAHSLRHAYASTLLGRGVPIADVAQWLGHRDISVTFATYRHMLPDAPAAAVAALDAEYAAWAGADGTEAA